MPAGQAAVIDTNGNSVTFASSLSGAGGLTKAGAGMLTLAASNSFAGTTNVNGGTLEPGPSPGGARQHGQRQLPAVPWASPRETPARSSAA